MPDKKYYVYVHRYASGPKEGQIFYVGKGCGRRSSLPRGRNDYWHKVVNKYGFTSEILIRFKVEECAFSFEVALIKFIGVANLVNLTSGGDGVRGYVWTESHRINLSKSLINSKEYSIERRSEVAKKNWSNKEYREKCTNSQINRFLDIDKSTDHKKSMNSPDVRLKLSVSAKERYENDEYIREVFTLGNERRKRKIVCKNNGMEFESVLSCVSFLKENGHPKASTSAISKVCSGKSRSAYGMNWKYV